MIILNNELNKILSTIESQYGRMKAERKQKMDQLRLREDEDQEVRTKEMKLRLAQGKGIIRILKVYQILYSQ